MPKLSTWVFFKYKFKSLILSFYLKNIFFVLLKYVFSKKVSLGQYSFCFAGCSLLTPYTTGKLFKTVCETKWLISKKFKKCSLFKVSLLFEILLKLR